MDAIMVRLLASGDTALVIEFGETIDREINRRVLALADRVWDAKIPGVIETVPTFRSLMVHYDPTKLLFSEIKALVEAMLPTLTVRHRTSRQWTLPTCYGGELGPDLEHVARATGLSEEAVIARHSSVAYHVYCIGFLPGYPYMGDLDPALELPRRETPRLKVPMGSVCIAQRMTGIYSLESPGGWHLLGRTPARMFDVRRERAVLLAPGDSVRFAPIPREEYDRLAALADSGRLDLNSTELQS
jgi:KipI family sensor histidine kinase inhibitor